MAAADSSVPEMVDDRFVPVAEWAVPVPLALVPRDWASADLKLEDSARADTSAVPRAELPVVSLVAPDDTPDLAKVRAGWPELADSAVADSAQWMVVAQTAPEAESAEDGCSPQADSQFAPCPLDSPADLPDDSLPESEWPVSQEAPASQLVRPDRSPDASSPTPLEPRARPDAVAAPAVVRRTAAEAAVASTSR